VGFSTYQVLIGSLLVMCSYPAAWFSVVVYCSHKHKFVTCLLTFPEYKSARFGVAMPSMTLVHTDM